MSEPHETHVCRDCGAEITLPYARRLGTADGDDPPDASHHLFPASVSPATESLPLNPRYGDEFMFGPEPMTPDRAAYLRAVAERSTWVDCVNKPGWQHPRGVEPECDASTFRSETLK